MPNSKATVSGDFGDLVRGADNAAKAITNLALQFSGIKTAAKAFDVASDAISGTINVLGKIGLAASGLEAIGKSAAAMGMGLLQGNANLEMVTISFQTLLGSASAAQDMLKQLTAFAASTPFELTGLEANTQKLLAFGFSAKDIIPLMTSMGDAISALGGTQDNLNSLVYVMGQMRQEAHINAGDIMQMVNLGIPALQMLADHYHVTTSQIQEMISKGLIPGNEAVAIFTDSLEKKYGGMMAAQSSTFSGMLSNLQDWFSATTIILTKPLFEPAKKALKAFLDFVQSPAGVAVINRMALQIQRAVDAATKAFIEFEPRIKPTLIRLLQIANAVRIQLTPGIISLIPLLFQLWERVEPVALAFYKFYQAVSPMSIAIAAIRGYITGGLNGALDALRMRFAMIKGYVSTAFNAALFEVRKFGTQLFSWVATTAVSLANRAVALGEALIQWVAPYAAYLIDELITLGGKVLTWVVWYAPIIANKILDWGEAIAGWVIPMIPRVLNLLAQLGFRVLGWLEQEIPVLVNMLLAWTDVLSGWIIPAIPGVIAALERVGAAILSWGVYRLPQIMGQVVVGVGQALGVNLRPAVNDVLVVFYSLVNSIRSTVLPAFREMIGYLLSDGMPLLNRLAAFIAGTIIPTFASLAAFVMTTVVPIFLTAADLLGRIFGPSLVLIGSIIRNQLLPYLTFLWQKFDSKYLTSVQTLASRLGRDLAGGVSLVVARVKEVLPHLQGLYDKIEPIAAKAWELYQAISPLSIAIDVLRGFLTGGIQGGLDAFSEHMGRIGDLAKDIIPKIIDGLTTVMPQVFDWISEQAPKILDKLGEWGDSFGKLVDKILPPLLKTLLSVGEKVLTWIVDKAPDILNKLSEWAGKFGEFAQKAIPILLDKLGDLITVLLKWLGDHAPEILTGLGEWTGRFVEWIGGLAQRLYPEFVKFVAQIWDWIGQKAPELANKLGDWAGAFLQWVVTDFIPGWIQMAPKIEGAILLFIGNMVLKIAGAMLGWVPPFLGWVGDVIRQVPGKLWDVATTVGNWIINRAVDIGTWVATWVPKFLGFVGDVVTSLPGKLWDIITGIAGWVGNMASNIANSAMDIGKHILEGIANGIMAAPGIIWDAVRGILGGLWDWVKGAIPGVPQGYAVGTKSARPGLALVGEKGAELIKNAQNQLLLATQPMLLNFTGGEQVFTHQQTLAMLPNPASAQQISNMYQTSNANRSWDYSQTTANSNNTVNHNYYGQGQAAPWSPGQQYKWYGSR
jgi:tape measure domain-containing protein